MATVKKANLRELAIVAGLAKPNDLKLFQMDPDGLIELLKPHFKGIEKLDDDQVLDLVAAEKKKGGGGGGKGADEETPRGRGRSSAKDEDEAPRGRGRAKVEEEDAPRGRGRASKDEDTKKGGDEDETPRGRGRGRRSEDEEPAKKPEDEAPRGRGRGRRDEPEAKAEGKSEKSEKDGGGNDVVIQLLEQVLKNQAALGDVIKALDAKVDANETGNAKALKSLKGRLDEVHVGVESIYLNDINKKDQSLADVLKRVSD